MSTTSPEATVTARDRTHYLYIAVIVAVVLGSVVGLVFPDFAVGLKSIGTTFVALIKMMIQPVIFCTLVMGVGSVRSAASVGKVGGLALAYFLTMSTFALAIGMVVGNLLDPGEGLNLSDDVAGVGKEQAAEAHGSTTEFITGIVPTRWSPRSPPARSSRPCSSRCSSASRCRRWVAPASRSCSASATCSAWSSGCSR